MRWKYSFPFYTFAMIENRLPLQLVDYETVLHSPRLFCMMVYLRKIVYTYRKGENSNRRMQARGAWTPFFLAAVVVASSSHLYYQTT